VVKSRKQNAAKEIAKRALTQMEKILTENTGFWQKNCIGGIYHIN